MNRRGFLTGVVGLLAAPAIVRAGSLMPVSAQPNPTSFLGVAPLKFEGTPVVLDYCSSNYEWFIFSDPRGAFGTVSDGAEETKLRIGDKLWPEREKRFRMSRWKGTPLHLG